MKNGAKGVKGGVYFRFSNVAGTCVSCNCKSTACFDG